MQRAVKLFVALGLFVSFSSLCLASSTSDNIARRKQVLCEDGNMLQATFCMRDELTESDLRLNVVYAELTQALKDPRGLRRAQRAWLAFRDAECKFDNADTQGSGANYSLHLCLMRLTETRVSTLEAVRPCNGCVEFKSEIYHAGFNLPVRKRLSSLPKLDSEPIDP